MEGNIVKTASTALLTLILMFAIAAPAQAAGPGRIGVKAGISIADESYEYSPNPNNLNADPNSRTGLTLGVFYEYPLIPHLAIRPGIEYVQKGAEITVRETTLEYPEGLGTIDIKDRIDYISIPVLASIGFPVGAGSTYIMAGPRVDIKARSDLELLVDADFKTTVFGLTFGAGQELPVKGLVSAFVEFCYQHDLGKAYEQGILSVKNKSFTVAAGVKF